MSATSKRSILVRSLAALCAAAACAGAAAQAWPSKPLRLIVPFPPGGATDILARQIGQKLGEQLGQQVIVDNRGGAGGNIGAEAAAKAVPDGHTLLLAPGNTLTVSPALYRKLAFDPVKDFTPVTQLVVVPFVLVVNPATPARSVQELVVLAKSKPDALSYASTGGGQITHLAGELFSAKVGASMVHVPYKGAAPAAADVIGGQVPMMFANLGSMLQFIKAGKVVPLALTTTSRHPLLPDLPTASESGLAGYDLSEWFGIVAPAGTPPAVVARLNAELVKIVQAQSATLLAQGFTPVGSTPEAFAQLIRDDLRKWREFVLRSRVRIE